MSKISIRKNYLYNLSYQLLIIITPLITTPYVSRVLGANGIGTHSYYESITSYFVLFANIGLSIYGQREIAYYREDLNKRSEIFWNLKVLSFITSLFSLLIYLIFGFYHKMNILYFILSLNIIAVVFDISWFFQGLEEFSKTVLRNTFCKIANIFFIYLFIKDPTDLALYTFGFCFFTLLGNISLWLYLPKYVNGIDLSKIKPFKDFKVVLILFIPTIAVQIYTVLDKTMIGLITQDSFQNGYYEQAMKITKIVLALVNSLGAVMIPRIGFHYNRGEFDVIKTYMYRGYRFVFLIGFPLCLGIVSVSSNFVPWFFGNGYNDVVPLLKILSFLIISIGMSNLTGMLYLIPTGREKFFTVSVIIGAIINFFLNLVLIPKFLSIGAAIASLFAESLISIVQFYFVRDELNIKYILSSSIKYILSSIVMFIMLSITGKYLSPSIFNTSLLVFSGGMLYFIVLFIIKDSFFIEHLNKLLSFIRSYLKKK